MEDNVVIIGNKPDKVITKDGQLIEVYPYLKPVIQRLAFFDSITIKTIYQPNKLSKINEIFEIIKWFGVREIQSRKFVYEPNKSNPNEKIKMMIIKWEIAPQVKFLRESMLNQIKEEKNA